MKKELSINNLLKKPLSSQKEQLLTEFISEFINPNTRRNYERIVKIFLNFLTEKKVSVRDISYSILLDFKRFLIEQKLDNASINMYLSAINSFMLFLSNKMNVPFMKINRVKTKKLLPRPFKKEEIKLLTTEIPMPLFLETAIFLCLYAGLRISEATSITKEDLIYEDGILKIRVKGKGEKERITYYIDKRSIEDILSFFHSHPKGIQKTPEELYYYAKKYIEPHIKDFEFHRLRHTFATILLNKGVNIKTLQELLGHSNINTTTIYTKLLPKSIEDELKEKIL
ncbi:MAG: tyrosine-type recombinase/integrase [candidate division WOR-3 bacterium]